MLKLGVIKESSSPYAAPIVMVPKKDHSIRLCCDFRKLNANTIFDPYVMPRSDHIIDDVGCSEFISTVDLTEGYWQGAFGQGCQNQICLHDPFRSVSI